MYFKDTVLIIMSEYCSILTTVIYMYKVQNLNYKLLNSKMYCRILLCPNVLNTIHHKHQ